MAYYTVLYHFRTSGVGGTILTNGHARDLHLFNKLTSYIMQEDLLRPNLSVVESMLISANLKLGDELSKADKLEAVSVNFTGNVLLAGKIAH